MKYDTIGLIKILISRCTNAYEYEWAHRKCCALMESNKTGSSAQICEWRADFAVETCFSENSWNAECMKGHPAETHSLTGRRAESQPSEALADLNVLSDHMKTGIVQKPVVLLYFREQRPPCFWSGALRLSNTKMSAVNNNEPTTLKSKLVQVKYKYWYKH